MRKAVAWTLAAAALMAFAALPGYGQTAQNVLDKMIEATGGRKALEAIKDTTITGTAEIVQQGMSAPITIYQKEPNKMRVDVEIAAAGMTFTQAYDGTKGWGTNQQSMAIEEMPEAMSKDLSHSALGNQAVLNPQKLGITYALKPQETIDGKSYIVLVQTLADGHKTAIFIDPVTYLPFKAVAKSLDMMGAEVDGESYMSDYRKVGGIMVAHSLRNLQNGAESMRLVITAVTFNTNLDDSLFIMK